MTSGHDGHVRINGSSMRQGWGFLCWFYTAFHMGLDPWLPPSATLMATQSSPPPAPPGEQGWTENIRAQKQFTFPSSIPPCAQDSNPGALVGRIQVTVGLDQGRSFFLKSDCSHLQL